MTVNPVMMVLCAAAHLAAASLAEAASVQTRATSPAIASLRDVRGDWEGALTTPSGGVLLSIRLTPGNAAPSGLMEMPEIEGSAPTALTIQEAGGRLVFDAPTIHASFTGEWDANLGGWSGWWMQSGYVTRLVLQRATVPGDINAIDLEPVSAPWDDTLVCAATRPNEPHQRRHRSAVCPEESGPHGETARRIANTEGV